MLKRQKLWHKMAKTKSNEKGQLILKQEYNDIMDCFEEVRVEDKEYQVWEQKYKYYRAEKEEVLGKNFLLFSKMIKFEGIILKAYINIELATVEAVKMYAAIEDEVQ